MAVSPDDYPVRFDVDYREDLSRLSTFFRLIVVIPILIVLAALAVSSTDSEDWGTRLTFAGTLVLAPLLMILFREKYPRWWFDWNLEILRFSARVSAYVALLTDEYPSTDEQQSVHLEIDYPNVREDLNRWLPLIKWLLAIPHYLILVILGVLAGVLVIFAWFAILFTGTFPTPFFDLVVGVYRWGYRVQAYAFLLVTDRYPPFSLS